MRSCAPEKAVVDLQVQDPRREKAEPCLRINEIQDMFLIVADLAKASMIPVLPAVCPDNLMVVNVKHFFLVTVIAILITWTLVCEIPLWSQGLKPIE